MISLNFRLMKPAALNYHHLRYFWTVAKEGSLRKASEVLHVSQPSISAQLRLLEDALGQPLFNRTGRRLILTDSGQLAFSYAEEMFALGQELVTAVRQRPGSRPVRFNVGIADSVPKVVASKHLLLTFKIDRPLHLVCREGSLAELVGQLVSHQLDVVLADEPATSVLGVRTFNHRLDSSEIIVCATKALTKQIGERFPQSLDGQPFILPLPEMPLRRQLEQWFQNIGIRPRAVAETQDTALMHHFAAQGLGVVAVYSTIKAEILRAHRLCELGVANGLRLETFAITAQRRLQHPGLLALTRG
jgi:LysR family transcriptional regulator, transcriptional activator of nhaA